METEQNIYLNEEILVLFYLVYITTRKNKLPQTQAELNNPKNC